MHGRPTLFSMEREGVDGGLGKSLGGEEGKLLQGCKNLTD